MFPEEKWLEKNLPNLIVNLCGRLRSRKIEERTHARDVLCEMSVLLGQNYFAYILSILEGGLQVTNFFVNTAFWQIFHEGWKNST